MLTVSATETASSYQFIVKDDESQSEFIYEWGKRPPEGHTKEEYLQSCKREAQLLAQDELDRSKEPTRLDI